MKRLEFVQEEYYKLHPEEKPFTFGFKKGVLSSLLGIGGGNK